MKRHDHRQCSDRLAVTRPADHTRIIPQIIPPPLHYEPRNN